MSDTYTWRDLLLQLIEDPREYQRIADAVGVSKITLQRWALGQNDPSRQNLPKLLGALPEYRARLVELMGGELSPEPDDLPLEIPAAFYTQFINFRNVTPLDQRFWKSCEMLFPKLLSQLDPQCLGMQIIVSRCMTPGPTGLVRSLLECYAQGTPPWRQDLNDRHLFLGAESLSGYAVTTGITEVIQNMYDDRGHLPARKVPDEAACAATPILSAEGTAGCLMASSTFPGYFIPSRLRLIRAYADLLALAFNADDFYPLEQIELGVMPPLQVQEPLLGEYRHRVDACVTQSLQRGRDVDRAGIERGVRRTLEEELLQAHPEVAYR